MSSIVPHAETIPSTNWGEQYTLGETWYIVCVCLFVGLFVFFHIQFLRIMNANTVVSLRRAIEEGHIVCHGAVKKTDSVKNQQKQ
jgi:hypothetical protein